MQSLFDFFFFGVFIRVNFEVFHIEDSVAIVFEVFSLIIFPNKFLELFQTVEEGDSPASVHEGWLQNPKVGRFALFVFSDECFGHERLAVEKSLGSLGMIVSRSVVRIVLDSGKNHVF